MFIKGNVILKEKTMDMTIGQMAKLNHISEKTLRLYHKYDIFVPKYVNKLNGYRYYSIQQSAQLDMIQQMRDIGLSLKQIKQILDKKDISFMNSVIEEHINQLASEIQKLSVAKSASKKLLGNCSLCMNKPICDKIVLEHIAERKMMHFHIKDYSLSDFEYPASKALQMWDITLRQVKDEFVRRKLPFSSFRNIGCTVKKEDLLKKEILISGAFVWVNDDVFRDSNIIIIPEQTFLCIYCDGISTSEDAYKEKDYICKLLKYIENQPYEITGDYIGEVLAETPAFLYSGRDMMLKIQIPVKTLSK
jgi:DNA-binding transcriptional MerR regulator/effector-binding domain-containing protein